MPNHGFGGRPVGSTNVHSSSADEIRAIVHAIDLAGEWPTPRKARRRGMRADNRRFTPIRDAMYLGGLIKTPPPKWIAWPPEKRQYMHSPGRVPEPEPEKSKADDAAWRPTWARVAVPDDQSVAERTTGTLGAFLAYRRAWRSLETFPVDFFRRIVPVVRRKKRKRVGGCPGHPVEEVE